MPENLESKNIEQLLAEADALINQINSDAIDDLQEEHRQLFAKHVQKLEKIKPKVKSRIEKKIGTTADGMHEAVLDIVKAMRNLTKYLT
jgi:hypothetical protein